MTVNTHLLDTKHSIPFAREIHERFRDRLGTLDIRRHRPGFPLLGHHTIRDDHSLAQVRQWMAGVGLEGLGHTVTLNLQPRGVSLPEHTDVGRATVIIAPISGCQQPLVVEGQRYHYHGRTMITDAKKTHSVPAHTEDRLSLQISLRHRFSTVLDRMRKYKVD